MTRKINNESSSAEGGISTISVSGTTTSIEDSVSIENDLSVSGNLSVSGGNIDIGEQTISANSAYQNSIALGAQSLYSQTIPSLSMVENLNNSMVNGGYFATNSGGTASTYLAFDGNQNTVALLSSSNFNSSGSFIGTASTTVSGSPIGGAWVQLECPFSVLFKSATIDNTFSPNRQIRTGMVVGSNDGVNFVLIGAINNASSNVINLTFSGTGEYRYVRVIVQTAQNTSGGIYFKSIVYIGDIIYKTIMPHDAYIGNIVPISNNLLQVSGNVLIPSGNLFASDFTGASRGNVFVNSSNLLVSKKIHTNESVVTPNCIVGSTLNAGTVLVSSSLTYNFGTVWATCVQFTSFLTSFQVQFPAFNRNSVFQLQISTTTNNNVVNCHGTTTTGQNQNVAGNTPVSLSYNSTLTGITLNAIFDQPLGRWVIGVSSTGSLMFRYFIWQCSFSTSTTPVVSAANFVRS